MATEMKQLLALLLLGCVFAVHGGEKRDPCTQGIAAVQLFVDYRGCPDPNPYHILGSLLGNLNNNMTVNNMRNVFTVFCSIIFPRIKGCFQRNIQNCPVDDRNSLMGVLQETGFVCQPNSDRIHHVIRHLLAKLTDADLAANGTCNNEELSMARPFCMNQSLEALGGNETDLSNVIQSLSMEDLVPMIQTFCRTMIECMVSQARTHLGSCPQWRGEAIRSIKLLILPPVLGKSMPFSTDDIDRLFQWQSDAQSPMNVEQDFLQALFK